ncbi:MAG: ParB N-terminal domain-containing protein [Alphaproteobacteria bacterium]|nr:ParB N-terminal domain-containing protein [Alphaproteobacteria bacterium]
MSDLIKIADIIMPPRLRVIDKAQVAKIAQSIKERGQLQPILLAVKNVQNDDGNVVQEYHLVDGAHRFSACILLQMQEIKAELQLLNDNERLLAEIDANLMRYELNELDKYAFVAKRKEIWVEMYGKPQGGDRGNQYTGGKDNEQLDMWAMFDKETQDLMDLSARTIQRYIQLYNALDMFTIETIKGTWIAKSAGTIKKLVEVGNLFGAEKQVQAAQALIDDPDLRTPQNALGFLNSGGEQDAYKRDANEIAVNKLKVLYIESNKEVKTAFIAYLINTPFFNETINEGIDGHE